MDNNNYIQPVQMENTQNADLEKIRSQGRASIILSVITLVFGVAGFGAVLFQNMNLKNSVNKDIKDMSKAIDEMSEDIYDIRKDVGDISEELCTGEPCGTGTGWYDPYMTTDKPVIYLYPQEETDVHVELTLTGSELATTYPKYDHGWDVVASPDGSLLNKADGSHHRYLFWDSTNCRTRYDFSRGFCVAGADTERFLKEKLTCMGLTEAEMNEFIVYWLPRMEHNPFNLIAFQGDAYTDSAQLSVTPAPDSECRIFMAYVPLDSAVEIKPQTLPTFERKGFAVVEWGGTEIGS